MSIRTAFGGVVLAVAVSLLSLLVPAEAVAGRLLAVGPARAVSTLAEAARLARDGDTVEVDAGVYARDVAVWTQDDLTLRAVGGRVRLLADGAAAEDKAIWVVRGGRVVVEGFDFEGARVAGRNGAGIRFEAGRLTVRDCRFLGNEMGLLTSNDARAVLVVENSEFAYNHRPDGHDHNLYIGRIAQATVTGSFLHHATHGHLLKSRAALSRILYNRLTDGADGAASYELEFPNGGIAIVVGNIVEQGPNTENAQLISYGAEGYHWPANELHLVHNTLVDSRAEPGVFLRLHAGAPALLRMVGNLLVGEAGWQIDAGATVERRGNVAVGREAIDPGDYRLRRDPRAAVGAPDAGVAHGLWLVPTSEYLHPRRTRPIDQPPTRPGAMQSPATSSR